MALADTSWVKKVPIFWDTDGKYDYLLKDNDFSKLRNNKFSLGYTVGYFDKSSVTGDYKHVCSCFMVMKKEDNGARKFVAAIDSSMKDIFELLPTSEQEKYLSLQKENDDLKVTHFSENIDATVASYILQVVGADPMNIMDEISHL